MFTMNQQNILPNTKEFNISWTTDSYAPVTDYFLYYRKNKVGATSPLGSTRLVLL